MRATRLFAMVLASQCFLVSIAWTEVGARRDPVSLYESGTVLQGREDWYGAIERYQEAVKLNPAYAEAWTGLAECFYALEEYGQADAMCDKALAYRSGDPGLLATKGFILIGLGKNEEASAVFGRVLSAWPNDVNARFGLAELEVASGRVSSAAGHYREALRRSPENRKALLSLALTSREAGNAALAREYLSKAMLYHGDNPQVFYYAGYIASLEGAQDEAERHARTALSLRPDYDEANELLSAVFYRSGRYSEVVSVCEARIAKGRDKPSAWYLKTLALAKMGKDAEALASARTGLQVSPDDEILRSLGEMHAASFLPFEDKRRSVWSAWHVDKARTFAETNLSDQALHEYRRALKLDPDDTSARLSYARLLLTRGYPARYLAQLEFIQSRGKGTKEINDAVESYSRLLSQSVQRRWNINPLLLDKAHAKIGIYYISDPGNILHPDSERVTAMMLADVFSYDMRFAVEANEAPVGSYSEAFRLSRTKGEDYFAIVTFSENKRDVQIVAELHVSGTGSRAETFSVYRTGNDRYANALRRLVQMIAQAVPVRGAIISRRQADAIIDLGKADGIKEGQSFEIVDGGRIRPRGEGLGLEYDSSTVLAVFSAVTVDEDITYGKIERKGFFDRVNSGDAVVPVKQEEGKSEGGQKADKTVRADPAQKTSPAIFALLRRITR